MKKILIILVFLLPLILAAQIEVGTNFGIIAELPIDNRLIMNTIGARDSIVWRYEGLTVYVISDSTNYQLQGGTDNSNWMYLDNTFYSPWAQNGNHVYLSTTTDSVGIGTATPSAILEVAGRIEISGTGNSVFIGEDAGLNDDLTNNDNVFIGKDAGYNTTSGSKSVAIGTLAGYSNEVSNYSISIGYHANRYNKGRHNVAIGYYANAAGVINSGEYNTVIGSSALSKNRGSGNIAIGYGTANSDVGASDNINSQNCIYVGNIIKTKAASQTNEIVIGNEAIGNGSNTATLGDNNVTDVYMNENGQANIHAGDIRLINSTVHADSILTTVIDSDSALITSGAVIDYVTAITPDSINFKVDATNISQVEIIIGNDTIEESFDHTHNNLALVTQLADYRPIADPSLLLGTDFKIIIYNDTMCGIKISTTDTVRIVPTR